MKRVGRGWARNAGNTAQIFVNGPQVVVRHILKRGPWHDLHKRTVKGVRQAVGGYGRGAARMQVIEVNARPHNLNKLLKSAAPLGQSSFVGRQVARNDVWEAWG